MRRRVLAATLVAALSCPVVVGAVPRRDGFRSPDLLLQSTRTISWNGERVQFKGERILAHAKIRKGKTLLVITDKHIRWLNSNGSRESVRNEESNSLCVTILEGGRSAVIGSRNAVTWYEFTRNEGVVTHTLRLKDQATSCTIRQTNGEGTINFRADEDGRIVTVIVERKVAEPHSKGK